jgi:hypothetical protein
MTKLRLIGCVVLCAMATPLVTMETFSVRGGQIHHVEAAPFVTLPYGLGNGWTPASGR